jgi:hypothetical protein
MTAYRYVVFPPGRQPTADEAAELLNYARLLENHIAYGTDKHDGGLAIAFEAELFDRALASNAGFESLIRKWEVRGCRLVDHLGFVKDAAALKPIKPVPRHLVHHGAADRPSPPEALLSAKELAAKEAHGRARLDLEQALQRVAALQRFAAWGPYMLMGLAAVGTIVAGFYISGRLLDADRERRQETIERLSADGQDQPLTAPSAE